MAEYLTSQDVENYGSELIDLTQRAALNVMAPTLQQIQNDNAQLRQRLAVEARKNLDQRVAQAVPNFREIDRDPRWHQFLLTIDPLTGRPLQTLLDDAIQQTDAVRVAAFFRKFQQQSGAQQVTGQQHTAGRRQQPAPHGRIYSRSEISKLYEKQRRGGFSEPEWSSLEHDIIAAGREGRVMNTEPLGPGMLTK